jgi:hypothetical protein
VTSAKLKAFALGLLEAPTDVGRYEALLAYLARIEPAHAAKIANWVHRAGGLRDSAGLSLVAELFCQRSGIAFAVECVEHVIAESSHDHASATRLLAKVREWIAGHTTKKEVLILGEKVAEEAREWERRWYDWYHAITFPIDKKTQHEIDSSQEPLFVYDAALAATKATQPPEGAQGTQLEHYRKWFTGVTEALSRSLEAVACRAPRSGKRQRELVERENAWRRDRLAFLLASAELTRDGFVA